VKVFEELSVKFRIESQLRRESLVVIKFIPVASIKILWGQLWNGDLGGLDSG
jgi:hypothetical protein